MPFENIMLQSAGSLSVAVLSLIMMLIQALFFFRRRQIKWYGWSAAISFSSLIYSIGIFIEYNTPAGPINRFSGLLEYTAIIFLIHCLYGFTFSYLDIESKRYHPIAGLFHILILILIWFTDYIVSAEFTVRHFIDIRAPYIELELGPLGPLFMLYAVMASAFAIIIWIRHRETEIKYRTPFAAGMIFWILLGIHDGLVSLGLHTCQYLMEYGFIGFALVVLWVVFDSYIEMESEEKYRVITEFLNDCIMVIQGENVVYGNPACWDLSGQSLTGLTAGDLYDRIIPEDREKVRGHFHALLEGGHVPKQYIIRVRKPDGEERFVEITSSLIKYRRRPAVLAIMRDMTERKQEEDALRESEGRYRALFEQAADSIVLIDPESGAVAGFNEKAYKDLGYDREEFEKLRISDFEAIESNEEVNERLKKIITEGADRFETKQRTKNGELRHISISSRSISIHGKTLVQSIWRDIGEIKRFQDALKKTNDELTESYRRLTGAYTHMREWKDFLGMYVQGEDTGLLVDKNGHIRGITDGVLEFTGLNTVELLKSNILDLVSSDDKQVVNKAIKDAWAGVYNQKSILTAGAKLPGQEFKAKFIKFSIRNERLVMILMRKPELEERKDRQHPEEDF
ncbi:MAG: PAS domain S-box protein [Deltaproteobacteria bacterium]|nr:PAS domain S-box protein [Deltaproteobacteria bacterium]